MRLFSGIALVLLLLAPVEVSAKPVTAQAVKMVNSIRESKGLAPLKQSRKLGRSADAHAQEMAKKKLFSHYGSDGSTPGKRARRQGYRFCYISENIAEGQHDIKEVMQAWMDSPLHRKNILSKEVRSFGMARSAGNRWVMVLARDGC